MIIWLNNAKSVILMTMKIFAINTVARMDNAPGRIMLQIAKAASRHGHEVRVAYGRGLPPKGITSTRIGGPINVLWHALRSRLDDAEGLASMGATLRLIKEISDFRPDIIHLHNLHGHYINYLHLFNYLNYEQIPVVWTLHDSWPYTGHCAFYASNGCDKWKYGCEKCDFIKNYPHSIFCNSAENYQLKKRLFTNAHIVAVSQWLGNEIEQSFLCNQPLSIIPNGIDAFSFRPTEINRDNRLTIVGVANNWEPRKNLDFFFNLAKQLPDALINIVGCASWLQRKNSCSNISFLGHITDPNRLSEIYSNADVFINASREETFGMTTIEAMACGTPVIVNNATALPEVITADTGLIVDIDNTESVVSAIHSIKKSHINYHETCRNHIITQYSRKRMTDQYLVLYNTILNKK